MDISFDRPGRALIWAQQMFGEVALDPRERTLRFLEEAIELAHAMSVDVDTTLAVVDRVYNREVGNIPREIGQATMTLECLARCIEVDADAEATKEFYRIQSIPKDEWERRHAAKKLLGIAS